MSTLPDKAATIDDVYRVEGQAELVGGRIVRFPSMGYRPASVLGKILRSLFRHVDASGFGEVFTSTLAYAIPRLASGRESFSPDASYYAGPLPTNPMRFIDRAPTFAVEVRSENDDGPRAEAEIAAKRADYFEAGTLVVWDVDPVANRIQKFTAKSPDQPEVFSLGQEADAEPAVAGWRVAVDGIFV
jgi:Uma2 family endonuclease